MHITLGLWAVLTIATIASFKISALVGLIGTVVLVQKIFYGISMLNIAVYTKLAEYNENKKKASPPLKCF